MKIRKNSPVYYINAVLFLAASCATGVIAVLLLQRIDKVLGL